MKATPDSLSTWPYIYILINVKAFYFLFFLHVYVRGILKGILLRRFEDETVQTFRANVGVGPGIEPVTFCFWGESDSEELPGQLDQIRGQRRGAGTAAGSEVSKGPPSTTTTEPLNVITRVFAWP